jgi:hypothetical protein
MEFLTNLHKFSDWGLLALITLFIFGTGAIGLDNLFWGLSTHWSISKQLYLIKGGLNLWTS